MNYKGIYDLICNRGKEEVVLRKYNKQNRICYYEIHHIIPKCMSGSNNENNLVYLTAREHYICHYLLVEIYPDNDKLKFALWNMVNGRHNKYDKRYIPNSRTYERIRTDFSAFLSKKQTGHTVSQELRDLYSKLYTGRKHTTPVSLETRKKLSIAMTGKIQSAEHRANISKALKGKVGCNKGKKMRYNPNNPFHITVTCPYCNKVGQKTVMSQKHFDNCKMHPDYIDPLIYKCDYCPKKYNTEEKLNKHVANCIKNPNSAARIKRKCTYCDVIGGGANMIRYHFENCKKRFGPLK